MASSYDILSTYTKLYWISVATTIDLAPFYQMSYSSWCDLTFKSFWPVAEQPKIKGLNLSDPTSGCENGLKK